MSEPSVGPTESAEVIVIGGGLSGLAAADRLAANGAQVLMLEASDRIGGRTFGWHWDAANREIDLGGTWLLPSFATAFRLLDELSIEHYDSPDAALNFTHFSEGIRARARLDAADELALTEVTTRLSAARAASELTAAQAIAAVEMPRLIQDWHTATQRYLAGAPLTEIDAAHLLLEQDELRNPDHYATQITGTTRSLADALARRNSVDIRTECPVTTVEHGETGWLIRTADNRTFSAHEVVMAIPRNLLGTVAFDPEPSSTLAELMHAPHVGASRKDWFILDDVAEHFRVFASEGPFGYFRSEARLDDGGLLAVGLAPRAEGCPSVEEFEAQIRHYLPQARIRAHFSHDWVESEWARGTWYAPRPGDGERIAAAVSPHPTLQFVGGDFSTDFPGTIEGALSTGVAAANLILARS